MPLRKVAMDDIKPKPISDYEGGKRFSYHRDRSRMDRYNRSVRRVKALDKPGKDH